MIGISAVFRALAVIIWAELKTGDTSGHLRIKDQYRELFLQQRQKCVLGVDAS